MGIIPDERLKEYKTILVKKWKYFFDEPDFRFKYLRMIDHIDINWDDIEKNEFVSGVRFNNIDNAPPKGVTLVEWINPWRYCFFNDPNELVPPQANKVQRKKICLEIMKLAAPVSQWKGLE